MIEEELADGARLREGYGSAFVLRRVKPTDPPPYKRNMNPSACRNRFRAALLGANQQPRKSPALS
jgi:hypothetical protein